MASAHGYNIPKLSASNYRFWKECLKCVLEATSASYVLTQDAPTGNADQLRKFKEKDGHTRALILGNVVISDNQRLLTYQTAKEMISHLDQKYAAKSKANSIFLKQKLFNSKMQKGDTMSVHLSKILNIYDELKVINDPPSESSMVAVILNSLPENYEVQIAHLRDKEDLSVDHTVCYLESEALRREQMNVTESVSVLKIGDSRYKGNAKKAVKCFVCSRTGHLSRDCWFKDQKDKDMRSPSTSSVRGNARGHGNGRPNHSQEQAKTKPVFYLRQAKQEAAKRRDKCASVLAVDTENKD